MKSLFSIPAIGAALAASLFSVGGAVVEPPLERAKSSAKFDKPRRRLAPDTSIINAINEELANGVKHPRFTITAHFENEGLFTSEGEDFELDVVLTNPSVTPATSYSVNGGPNQPVQSTVQYLIADTGEGSSTFAILAVGQDTVQGIVHKDKKLVTLKQEGGGSSIVAETNYDPPKDWKCMVIDEEDEAHTDRHLVANHNHHHSSNHHHTHQPFQGFDINIENRRRIYATDQFPKAYSYQADMYIEVDSEMVKHHDPYNQEEMPNTINYINALITAISSVYEREVDTHLHVLHIAKTDMYDNFTDATAALNEMQNHFKNTTNWHYQDDTGAEPDLHHGIFYKAMGGGVAKIRSACNPMLAYGVSTGVTGSIANLTSFVNGGIIYWDIWVVAHELGHNLGSRHTHDEVDYNPLIDSCGLKERDNCTSEVDGEPISSGDGTIMSYCHLCSGGISNTALTFGGYWLKDDRRDVNNWRNTDGVEWSLNPRRVSHKMYEFISSRTCVEPKFPIPNQTCTVDKDCNDGNSCSIDKCNGDQCENIMQNNCCGNKECEVGESSCNVDCGPFELFTPDGTTSARLPNLVFDVKAESDILLSGISFKLSNGGDVTVYTAPGGFDDTYRNDSAWTQVFTNDYGSTPDMVVVKASFLPFELPAGSIQAFKIYSSNSRIETPRMVGDPSTPLRESRHMKIIRLAKSLLRNQVCCDRGITTCCIMYGPYDYSFDGSVVYSLMPPNSSSPTSSAPTSISPITSMPLSSAPLSLSPTSTSPITSAPTSKSGKKDDESESPVTDTPTKRPSKAGKVAKSADKQ